MQSRDVVVADGLGVSRVMPENFGLFGVGMEAVQPTAVFDCADPQHRFAFFAQYLRPAHRQTVFVVWLVAIHGKSVAIVAVQAILGGKPHKPLFVLQHIADVVLREAIIERQMVEMEPLLRPD